jgi:Na+-transporting NADH:ubiquinone oxidoreductase subunit B
VKSIEKLMRKFEPQHDSKWSKLHPMWDGFYTFLFTPGETTQKGSHIRDGIDLKRTMFTVVIALIPALLFGMYNTGHFHYESLGEAGAYGDLFWDKFIYGLIQVLPIVVVSYAVGLGVEFMFCIKNQHAIQEGFLVSGMLIPLIVPVDVPLWMVAVATIFAVVIGKEVFGGTGMNIVNVALTARAFLFIGYPTKMSGDKVWVSGLGDESTKVADGFSGATPLGDLATAASVHVENTAAIEKIAALNEKIQLMPNLKDQLTEKIQALEVIIKGNSEVISNKMAAIPSLYDSVIGSVMGSIGETSIIAIGIGAIILLATGIASWRVMLSFIAGGFVMGLIFNFIDGNPFQAVDPLKQLALGGFAFGAVFMITDPVTAAQTNTGKFIYGFLAGFFAILVRVFNTAFPEGVMMSILFFNVMAPLIDHYVIQANVKRRLKRVKTKKA